MQTGGKSRQIKATSKQKDIKNALKIFKIIKIFKKNIIKKALDTGKASKIIKIGPEIIRKQGNRQNMRVVKANQGNQEAKSSQKHPESKKIISKQASESFRNHQNPVSGSPESSKSSISGPQSHQIVSYPGISSSQGSYPGIIQENKEIGSYQLSDRPYPGISKQNHLETIKIQAKS